HTTGKAILTPSEMSRPLVKEVKDKCQSMWNDTPINKLKLIKKDVKPWGTSSRKCRREEVVLTRPRIGHTRLIHSDLISKTLELPVSWLRRKDDNLQLISVDTEVYSPDPRYRISFTKPADWQLHVQSVNLTDQGHYECQVNSHPPIVYSIYVHVVVPELEIKDERDIPIKNKFYNSGSTIELRCLIVRVPQPTQFILWRHNSTILNYDTTRGGISVKTDILPDGAKSQLYIANVGPTDSGNYSCSLGEDTMTWISVVVITGETPAAMQHGSAATAANLGLLTILSAVLSAVS
ncbi:opioid-binding protein/cell adhesion molecule-like, partial [Halyomorpha halys]|uniref:opioid-binding protein/cell adhesion molecule-like n=1 Tax=Halyomorpha halys TaxID=286706 RepID=UPI0034D30E36